jgi:ABC-type multidrug transport system fused ATPase/permease subunit
MLEILLLGFVFYLVFSRIKKLKTDLTEKIKDLEGNIQYLEESIRSVKKELKHAREGEKRVGTADSSAPGPHPVQGNPPQTDGHVVDNMAPPAVLNFSQPLKTTLPPETGESRTDNPEFRPDRDKRVRPKSREVDDKLLSSDSSSGRTEKKYDWLSAAKSEDTEQNCGNEEVPAARSGYKSRADAGSGGNGKGPGDDGLPPGGPDWSDRWNGFIKGVDWERFTGANLFAWLGGLALFIGAGFFVKYSIDKNLISPILRLVIGALAGLLMIGASCRFERGRYDTMRQTFAAGGIGVLYSVFFAATLYYEYLARPAGFAALVTVSAAAFVLAVFHRGVSIAVLGGTGAYITPLLVSTGSGNLLTLLLYLAIVNVGLIQVMQRLQAAAILPFAAGGTLFSLACATVAVTPWPEGAMIGAAWIANLLLFSIFIIRADNSGANESSLRLAGILTFLAMPMMAFWVIIIKDGSAPMAMMAAAVVSAMWIAFRRQGWNNLAIPYCSLTFLIAALWTFFRFNNTSTVYSFVAFFVYGLAGGFGPVMLLRKHGADKSLLRWFKVFPVALGFLMLMAIIITPDISPLFWPMAMGLQLTGVILSMLFRQYSAYSRSGSSSGYCRNDLDGKYAAGYCCIGHLRRPSACRRRVCSGRFLVREECRNLVAHSRRSQRGA